MDEQLVNYLRDRLFEAHTALLETEQRLSDVDMIDDAQRSLARVNKAITSALQRLNENSVAEGE